MGELRRMGDQGRLFQRIKFFIESKNYPAALRELRQEVEANPNDPQVCFWLGVCLAEIKEYTEAEQFLKRAAALDPENRAIAGVLDAVQKRRRGEGIPRPLASNVFEVGEPVEYKKKECPNCLRLVGVESWQCGYCKQVFWKRIASQLAIFFAVFSILIWAVSGWFSGFMGMKFQPAKVVNKAGDNGKRVQITNPEWNCVGLGLTQARGTGFNALVRGCIKNIGDRAIEKATITIFFQYDNGNDVTFIWFDVYSWRSGDEFQFEFPGVYPPGRPDLCELRIESVKLFDLAPVSELKPEFYVPYSDHFRSYRFARGENTLDERSYKYYKPADSWTFRKLFHVYIDIMPSFLFNYLCVLLAVILVNLCDPERKWNSEWKMDAVASAFVVMGFVALNVVAAAASAVIGMLGMFSVMMLLAVFCIKLYLFYLFFRRSIGFTFIMIVFYVCLTMGFMGLWYNIAGAPAKPVTPQLDQSSYFVPPINSIPPVKTP